MLPWLLIKNAGMSFNGALSGMLVKQDKKNPTVSLTTDHFEFAYHMWSNAGA